MTAQISGQPPFSFRLRADLDNLPSEICENETHFHTMLTTDPDTGDVYYTLLNIGLIKLSPDLTTHDIIHLSSKWKSVNFHSVRLMTINGAKRLILSANDNQQVIVMTLSGEIDFTLGVPTLAPYQADAATYEPTDTCLVGDKLYIADGYGDQFISIVDITSCEWITTFGGKTEDRMENGKFRTAHGINLTPDGQHLVVADRWNSRLQIHDFDGEFVASHHMPYNAWVCGIDWIQWQGKQYGVIACLYDTDEDKQNPAPIFILNSSYEIISTLRPKQDFGIEEAQRLHNAIWHIFENQLFLICHSWNPGKYFVLELKN
ncbi:MAG: hypothetical protein ACFE0Q_04905 [Anaerolineae bacterium]